MSIYLQLFWEFFKIGAFAVGGGMATIPFLQRLAETSGWFDTAFISDMIAISESTPGPIGINMATYVGCKVADMPIAGGVIATIGTVVPAVIIVSIVAMSLERFRKSRAVEWMFEGLRPAVTGLIAAAGAHVIQIAIMNREAVTAGDLLRSFHWQRVAWCVLMFVGIKKFKKHPVLYIAISAAAGIAAGAAGVL